MFVSLANRRGGERGGGGGGGGGGAGGGGACSFVSAAAAAPLLQPLRDVSKFIPRRGEKKKTNQNNPRWVIVVNNSEVQR